MWRERKQKNEDSDNKITATRARGIILLVSALFLFQVCLLFYNRCIRGREIEIVSSDTTTITTDNNAKTNTNDRANAKAGASITNNSNSLNIIPSSKIGRESLFLFNPNTISLDSLCLLGLSKKQAQIIINYRNKGGKFRKKEDFAKMYSVSESFYNRVESYIYLNQKSKSNATKSNSTKSNTTKPNATESNPSKLNVIKSDEFKTSASISSKNKYESSIINLNSADSLQLVSLYGIGPYYAKQILEYRKRIGSYAYVEQLLEIRGIDSTRLDKIINRIQIPESSIKKFSLDTVSVDFMKRNPYIGAYATQGIILLRNQSNADTLHITPQLLLKEKILNQKQVRKLMLYCE